MLCKEFEHEDNVSAVLGAIRYVLDAHGPIAGIEYAPRCPAFFLALLLMNNVPTQYITSMASGLVDVNALDLRYLCDVPMCYVGLYHDRQNQRTPQHTVGAAKITKLLAGTKTTKASCPKHNVDLLTQPGFKGLAGYIMLREMYHFDEPNVKSAKTHYKLLSSLMKSMWLKQDVKGIN